MTLPELAATLGPERDSLIVSVAALQLIPDNATKWMRFERVIEACSGAELTTDQHSVSPGRLRRLLTSDPVVTPALLSAEDPFEESFTAEIMFYGGSHTVVMGGATAAHSACQLVLEATRRLDGEDAAEYRQSVFADATALLTLSREMCRRVGLGRWVVPAESPRTPLRVPARDELQRLQTTVSFAPQELSELLGPLTSHVDNLVAPGPMGLVDHDDESPTDERMYLYPLLRLSDGSVVIPVPGAVAGAVVHRALARAVAAHMTDVVVGALHDVAQRTVGRYLSRLRWLQIITPDGLEGPASIGESFWQFDVDKVAHILTVVDPLHGYEAGKPYASVELGSIQEELHQRFVAVRQHRDVLHAREVLHIVCSTVLGRSWFLGFTDEATDDHSALLALTVDDLDVLTGLEPADPLALWKFARASTRLHGRSRVMSFSKLDEFAIYRTHNDGFYLSDDGLPDMLSVSPGTGSELRIRERRRRDPHSVALPAGNGIVEVARWAADDEAPIYRPEDPQFHGRHVVELALPCWVVPTPEPDEPAEPSEDLAEAVAFWLWQCRDHLAPPLAGLSGRGTRCVIVRVRLAPQADEVGNDPSTNSPTPWMQCEALPSDARVDLTLLETAAHYLRGPSNDAERAMAGELVAAIHALDESSLEGLAEAITHSLPSGPMKMFQVFGQDDDPLLALGYTARPRLVAAADIEDVLDDVGEICRDDLGLADGRIADDDRTTVLNSVVAELFTRMGEMVAQLGPDGLLEHLASEQEAIAFLDARDRLLVPSQAACFGEDSVAVRRAVESRQSLTSTAVTGRFLIEYATAVPPNGREPLSVSTYDRLLAYATEIVEFGYLSDAIRYGLSTSELSVLPSGRLGSTREEGFHETVHFFTQLRSRRSLDAARRAFDRHWKDPAHEEAGFDPTDLNAALVAEFGLTAAEHAELSGDLIDLTRDTPRRIATYSIDELVQRLSDTLGWEPVKVRRALDLFLLGPLSAFPPATNAVDTYPWRFSRDRSAARRPLYARPTTGGGLEVVWGPRSVYRSSRYLLDQMMSARLKANSTAMKHYVAAVRREANDDFNHQVANLYRQAGCDEVRENVKRFGSIRLQRANGEDIGDIDVLVVDRTNKVLVLVEVKDFEFARTPFELSNELEKLLGEDDSATSHHQERVTFVKANLARVLVELGIGDRAADWQVHGLVVTSADLMGAHFRQATRRKPGLKIVSFEDLSATDPRSLTARTRVNPSTRRDRRRRRRRRR